MIHNSENNRVQAVDDLLARGVTTQCFNVGLDTVRNVAQPIRVAGTTVLVHLFGKGKQIGLLSNNQ